MSVPPDPAFPSDPSADSLANDAMVESVGAFHGIIGRSAAMLGVYRKILQYGPAEAPVLITGETGTGKELVARALHERSRRRGKPFVALNCTALNEELFESELFGHERGAFTGAERTHRGRFERANGGSLFLDEIGDMSGRVQGKMLRAMEEGIIERVGGENELNVDVRLIAATNVSLEQAVQIGRFRADLYHRLAVLRIHMPALRERHGDIPILVGHFLSMLNERYRRRVQRLTPEAVRALEEYSWPGNVRELRNVLERIYVETNAPVIGRNALAEWERERDWLAAGEWNVNHMEHQRMTGRVFFMPSMPAMPGQMPPLSLPAQAVSPQGQPAYPLAPLNYHPVVPGAAQPPRPIDVDYIVEPLAHRTPGELNEQEIRDAFAKAKGNLTRAAELLGVHKTTLYRNMKRLGLGREELEKQK